jgi:PST family polysaccharide transporter/lipopolysaccharide exporter
VKTAFLRTFRATTAVTLPAAVGVALVAPAFVPAVLGPAWLDAVPLLRAIGVYAAVVALTRLFVPVWTALGRPDYTVRTALVRLAVLAATIVPAVRTFGVLGAILAVGGSFLVAELPLRTYVLRRVAGVTVRELAREVAYPAVATLGMAAVVLQVTGAAWPSPAVELVVAVAVGAATYGALALALDRLGWGIGGTAAALARAVSAPPR